jgi:hypothetical protein
LCSNWKLDFSLPIMSDYEPQNEAGRSFRKDSKETAENARRSGKF